MKKLFVCLILSLFLVLPNLAFSQTWVTANQATVSWDAVTTLSNGTPVPTNDIIEYTVYLSNAITDPAKTNPAEVATVSTTEQVITLVDEGQYFVGLKTVRSLVDGTVIGESDIGWTDDSAIVLNGETFGVRYFLSPNAPINVRSGN
jgi:archaellum component FlaF (FlaF/FlaG flagellin family)